MYRWVFVFPYLSRVLIYSYKKLAMEMMLFVMFAVSEDIDDLIEYHGAERYTLNNEPVYAFLCYDGSVHYNKKHGMQEYLITQLPHLDKYPFVKLEVLEFLEEYETHSPSCDRSGFANAKG